MGTNKKIIGIDFDDVLLDFRTPFCLYINSIKNTTYTRSDMTDFYFEKVFGCSRQEVLDFINGFYESEEHLHAPTIAGAQEAIKKLSKHYSLSIISARPEYLRERTEQWIQKHFGNMFETIHLNNQYHGDEIKKTKAEVCQEIGAEIYVDDLLENAEGVANTGRKVFLLDSPWNQGEIPQGITRAYSWNEIVEALQVTA